MSSRGSPPVKQAAGLADPARKLALRFGQCIPQPAGKVKGGLDEGQGGEAA